MLIKKVRISGFERLFEGYQKSNKENRTGFGDGLMQFLIHCSVAIELKDISIIELFYLHKFSSKVQLLHTTYGNFTNAEKDPAVHQKVEELLKIHDTISHDSDIPQDSYLDTFLPAGCCRCHVIAFFTGVSITSITGALLRNFFLPVKEFGDLYPGDLYYENELAGLFYESFYKFMNAKSSQMDIISDLMINNSFYRYIDNRVNLSYIQTPYGSVELFGADATSLAQQKNRIVSSMQTTPYLLDDLCTVCFAIESTFASFLDINLNTPYVVDHSNLKLVMTYDTITIDNELVVAKYNARITNGTDYLLSYRKQLMNQEAVDLGKYNFIFLGNPIQYTISIPLSKIPAFCEQFSKRTEELKDIADSVKSQTDVIRNYLGLS